ncbi:hypothetical protein NLG97_g2442 [Lecanicillium saksenae]|uniref:Uncharacterized protein n=1 Tax=Lecanicillium saksenae TaxID=468837 RepID=A0ACC1R2A3_9HYPO|nr:hypothetical protein NLG97_g2442 [Lecanicillium saksenae]
MAFLTRAAGAAATHTVIAIIYLGAFSRFTHGAYTPAFYEYQRGSRAGQCVDADDSRRRHGAGDAGAGARNSIVRLVLLRGGQVMGLGLRLREGKDSGADAVLLLATVVALATSVIGDVRAARKQ